MKVHKYTVCCQFLRSVCWCIHLGFSVQGCYRRNNSSSRGRATNKTSFFFFFYAFAQSCKPKINEQVVKPIFGSDTTSSVCNITCLNVPCSLKRSTFLSCLTLGEKEAKIVEVGTAIRNKKTVVPGKRKGSDLYFWRLQHKGLFEMNGAPCTHTHTRAQLSLSVTFWMCHGAESHTCPVLSVCQLRELDLFWRYQPLHMQICPSFLWCEFTGLTYLLLSVLSLGATLFPPSINPNRFLNLPSTQDP